MKKLVLASAAAIAVLGLAACSDATDETTTQGVPPIEEPAQPGTTTDGTAPATDGTATTPVQPAPAQ